MSPVTLGTLWKEIQALSAVEDADESDDVLQKMVITMRYHGPLL
jgi:hypothetical protein